MPYMTSAQIEAKIIELATASPALCTRLPLPNATVSTGIGPTNYSYFKIANGAGAGRPAVLIMAGIHARELAQPDATLSFSEKLLNAYRTSSAFVIPAYTDPAGNTFGPVSVAAAQVQRMVDTLDILILPLANPDGRAYCLATGVSWRKNRAPPAVPGDPSTIGVDLNRNFDIAWDFKNYYTAAAAAGARVSDDPTSELYCGAPSAAPGGHSPTLQPEVQNVLAILAASPVTFFIDLHSYSALVMHPWAIERDGNDPTQTFQNAAFDQNRDGILGNAYSEFFPNTAPVRLLDRHRTMVASMGDGVRLATGRVYTVGGTADTIYPATGTSTDYVFSRQFLTAGAAPVHAFAVEFGDAADNFQPDYADPQGYPKIEREVHAVLLRFLDAATPPAVAPASGSGSSSSICSLSVAAEELALGAAWLAALRRGRGELLAGRLSRGPMLALDRAYRVASRRIAPWLAARRWARRLVAWTVLAPAGALAAAAFRRAGG
jgi:hypothetical protein